MKIFILLAFVLATLFGQGAAASPTRTLPTPLRGVTLDNDGGAGTAKINAQVAALKALPHIPITRIVLDPNTTPADYTKAVNALTPISYTMGELVDSSSLKATSVAAYHNKTATFLNAFGNQIDLWEVGNEVNGNWTGPYAGTATKIIDAYNQVHAAGDQSALTLWENSWAPNHCGDGNGELTAQQFSTQYVPLSMRNGLNYVFLSWYPTECSGLNNLNVPATTISTEVQALHVLYPNAKIGFGELGLPRRVSSGTLAQAQGIATYYYQLNLGLSYYVGGYFWWYGGEDLVPATKPMWQTISSAMQ